MVVLLVKALKMVVSTSDLPPKKEEGAISLLSPYFVPFWKPPDLRLCQGAFNVCERRRAKAIIIFPAEMFRSPPFCGRSYSPTPSWAAARRKLRQRHRSPLAKGRCRASFIGNIPSAEIRHEQPRSQCSRALPDHGLWTTSRPPLGHYASVRRSTARRPSGTTSTCFYGRPCTT